MGAGSCSCFIFHKGSLDCSDTISGDNTQVKRLVHIDFLNLDKSLNTDGDITGKQEFGTDEEQHMRLEATERDRIEM